MKHIYAPTVCSTLPAQLSGKELAANKSDVIFLVDSRELILYLTILFEIDCPKLVWL
jgi:hypothetical protein